MSVNLDSELTRLGGMTDGWIRDAVASGRHVTHDNQDHQRQKTLHEVQK